MAIVVGSTVLELRLPETTSLKDKRRIITSVIERVKRHHNVAIADVGARDDLRTALLAVSSIGTGEARCRRTLDTVADLIYTSRPDAELMPHSVEITQVG